MTAFKGTLFVCATMLVAAIVSGAHAQSNDGGESFASCRDALTSSRQRANKIGAGNKDFGGDRKWTPTIGFWCAEGNVARHIVYGAEVGPNFLYRVCVGTSNSLRTVTNDIVVIYKRKGSNLFQPAVVNAATCIDLVAREIKVEPQDGRIIYGFYQYIGIVR